MSSLISLALFGIVISYFAIQNTALVSLKVPGYIFIDIPLYLVILGSLLLGFLIAGIVSSIDSMFASFRIMGKNRVINDSQKQLVNLQEKIHDLELENAELRGTKKVLVEDRRLNTSEIHAHDIYHRVKDKILP